MIDFITVESSKLQLLDQINKKFNHKISLKKFKLILSYAYNLNVDNSVLEELGDDKTSQI